MTTSFARFTGALMATATAASMFATLAASAGQDDRRLVASPEDAGVYRIALDGDMPYGDAGRAQYPNVIDEINRFKPAFTVFDGDTKSGKELCTDDFYPANKAAYFDVYQQPIVYSVGDNEWTDCDRASNGSFDPNTRLALIRQTYFSTPYSMGHKQIRVERQAGYPENQRWSKGAVTYAAVNVVGSNNNYPVYDATGKQVDGDAHEAAARDAAVQQWLRDTFAQAKARGSVAVMVVLQADLDWYGRFAAAGKAVNGFAATKQTLLQQSVGFKGQVVLVNGDSHTFIVDKPLFDTKGRLVENFTRVQTFGSKDNHWVSADVNPRDPQVFTFHQHIVRANLTDHTGAAG